MEYIARHYHIDLALARPLPSSGIRKLACARAMAGRWQTGESDGGQAHAFGTIDNVGGDFRTLSIG